MAPSTRSWRKRPFRSRPAATLSSTNHPRVPVVKKGRVLRTPRLTPSAFRCLHKTGFDTTGTSRRSSRASRPLAGPTPWAERSRTVHVDGRGLQQRVAEAGPTGTVQRDLTDVIPFNVTLPPSADVGGRCSTPVWKKGAVARSGLSARLRWRSRVSGTTTWDIADFPPTPPVWDGSRIQACDYRGGHVLVPTGHDRRSERIRRGYFTDRRRLRVGGGRVFAADGWVPGAERQSWSSAIGEQNGPFPGDACGTSGLPMAAGHYPTSDNVHDRQRITVAAFGAAGIGGTRPPPSDRRLAR